MAILRNAEGEEIDKEWKNYCVIDERPLGGRVQQCI